MNARLEALKWAALAAMVADHVGFTLAPDLAELRLVGRFAVPALLWVMAYRLTQQGRAERMWSRLLLWVPAAEVAHGLMVGPGQPMSVFVTLAGAAAVVQICDDMDENAMTWRTVAQLVTAAAAVAWAEFGCARSASAL